MDVAESYSQVAKDFAKKIFHELEDKPRDQEILGEFAKMLGVGACISDLGCGPGQIARFLHEKGLKVSGIDISPGMVAWAKNLNPEIEFQVGSMLDLPLLESSVDGATAFYSLIHISPSDLLQALNEIKRVVRPLGYFLFSFHIGKDKVHLSEWWGHKVNLDFYHYTPEYMEEVVLQSGWKIIKINQRPPYAPEIEVQTERAYFLLQRPFCLAKTKNSRLR